MIMWMKNVNNFQIVKVQVLLSICLIFCQFQPGVAYKSVTYKKACSSTKDTFTKVILTQTLCKQF